MSTPPSDLTPTPPGDAPSAQTPETMAVERFRVERVLGQGGMGQVLAAYDTLRGRRVALKRMRSDRPGEVRRLKEEFRALSDLAHLNLCALYDIHEVDS